MLCTTREPHSNRRRAGTRACDDDEKTGDSIASPFDLFSRPVAAHPPSTRLLLSNAMTPSVSSLLVCVLLFLTLYSCASSAQTVDPCEASCCSAGWLFYGEGNYSKLGVNGSSDCNCFDTQITACPKDDSFIAAQVKRADLLRDWGVEAVELRAPEDTHCMGACCSVGHALWGNGDYARINTCNCAMQLPTSC